ncbi:MAG: DUF3619 family protein [Pseudomonadota bacterium]
MNLEEQFAARLCRTLDQGACDLDADIALRLQASRWRALDLRHCPREAGELALAGTTVTASRFGGRSLRTLLTLLAVLLGMGGTYYWNGFEQADINEEIDSALLADDLPPKAYLDPGFQAWLSHYAQSAR